MEEAQMSDTKTAELYRMVMKDHLCPYGLKSKHLLEAQGFHVEDHHLKDRKEIEAFKAEHDVDTTPQTFIDGTRIGGYDELQTYFGKEPTDEDEKTYWPVISLVTTTFLMALGALRSLKDNGCPYALLNGSSRFQCVLLRI